VGCYPPWQAAAPGTVVAAEHRTGVRGPGQRHAWTTEVDQAARAALAALPAPAALSAWYTTAALRSWAGPAGTVAAVPGELRARLEAKPAFDAMLAAAGVPTRMRIPCVTIDGPLPALDELRRRVGTAAVVVQSGADSGGRGTVFVHEAADLARAAAMPGPYKVAAFVPGWSSNTTVLSVPDGSGGVAVYVDRPSHKAIGIAAAGIGPAKSAGNDWSRPWPEPAAARLVDAAARIGRHLWRTHRLAGLFGLDAILTDQGEVMFNEINVRNQGTTEVSGVNQQLRGVPPFLAAHLTVLLGGRPRWLPPAEEFNAGTIAAAARPGPGPFYLKLRHHGTGPAVLSGLLRGSGVYRLHGGRLSWLRPGAHPADADADTDEVLLANLPAPHVVCLPGAELGTAEGITTGPASPFAGPHELSPTGRALLAALGRALTPAPPNREATP
jgi:hypothetical protein